jgi:triacylglycerol lipase
MKQAIMLVAAFAIAVATGPAFARDANKTLYPIVFAHGMAGFDDILGYDYWGDDYGVYVLDTCQWGESYCNHDINSNQQSFVGSVTPFQSSEQRGYELYQDILGYMASSGAQYVNIIGHSQGGLDLRKAAKSLYTNKARNVVKYGISISSPHRGSPIAKHVWNLGPGVSSVIETLAEFYGNIVYGPGNDAYAALKQLIHDDISSTDGITTGTKIFNTNNPASTTYIARPRSLLTAQQGGNMNPALYIVNEYFHNPDADGYATTDADGDGALGIGNGNPNDTDDDGLVGLNSQQMGYRLEFWECYGCLDYVWEQTNTGNVTNLNAPPSVAMTSKSWVISQDHLDVVGVPPDTFDEMEFYAAITDYIADNGF